MLERVAEMVLDVMSANGLDVDDFISRDLHRHLRPGLGVPGVRRPPARVRRRPPRSAPASSRSRGRCPGWSGCSAHVETDLPRADITHVYLHGAANLRRDLTRVREVPERVSHPEARTGPVPVVGAGLLGTSIALALRRAGVDVALRDVNPENLRIASGLGAANVEDGGRRPAARRGRRAAGPARRDRSPRRCATPTPSSPTWAASRAPPLAVVRRPGPGAPRPLRRQPPDGRQRAVRAVRGVGGPVRRPALGGHPARRLGGRVQRLQARRVELDPHLARRRRRRASTAPTPRTASRLRVTWSSTNHDSASSSIRLDATV